MDAALIRENNARILALMSTYLNCFSDSIDGADVRDIARTCHVEPRFAYAQLLAAVCGLDTRGADAMFFREWFLPMIQAPEISRFTNDAYYRGIRLPHAGMGVWELTQGRYAPYEAFVCGDLVSCPNGKILPQIGFFEEEFVYPVVQEGGREWMSITPNEIITMEEPVGRAHGKVLTFGLGLGYFAYMASLSDAVSEVCVVERDPDVIALFERNILPQFPRREKVRLVCMDAFEYAREHMAEAAYDFVFTDIWHDPSDGAQLYLQMKQCERYAPGAEFSYWCEDTIRCYL